MYIRHPNVVKAVKLVIDVLQDNEEKEFYEIQDAFVAFNTLTWTGTYNDKNSEQAINKALNVLQSLKYKKENK